MHTDFPSFLSKALQFVHLQRDLDWHILRSTLIQHHSRAKVKYILTFSFSYIVLFLQENYSYNLQSWD